MTAALIAISIAGFGFAATAVALAIRQAGLREVKTQLAAQLGDAHRQLEETVDELERTRKKTEAELELYRERLRELSEAINALPDNPGNRRIVLDELDRLLSPETTEDDHDDG